MSIRLCALLAVGLAQTAYAGEVTGKVTAETDGTTGRVVVWVEGLTRTVPSEQPQISQKNARFNPDFLVVVVGQTVSMPNDDNIAHNVYSFSPAKKFNLGIYAKGTSKSVTFDATGVVELYCSIHRRMSAKIVVVPSTAYAVGAIGDSFTIKDVPAGKYTVRAWGEGQAEPVSQKVTVQKGGKVSVKLTFPKGK